MDKQQVITENLKELLPKGAITRVAKKHSVSIDHVSRVLHGKKKNPFILDSLYEEAAFSKSFSERVEQKIIALQA